MCLGVVDKGLMLGIGSGGVSGGSGVIWGARCMPGGCVGVGGGGCVGGGGYLGCVMLVVCSKRAFVMLYVW